MKFCFVPQLVKDEQRPLSNFTSKVFFIKLLMSFLIIGVFTAPSVLFGQSADIDQVRNGAAGAPISPVSWVNGNAGPSNAHYSEGYSIPYRMYMTGLSIGNHELIIEWDTKQSGGHAIDYITHYNSMDNPAGSHFATFAHAPEVVDPTVGIGGLGAPGTFPIPAPSSTGSEVAGQPTASFNALPAGLKLMTIWNGTITSLTYVNEDPQDGSTSSTASSLSIKFTASSSSVLVAWGGHIAAEYDWGVGRGATGVSGSPYHTRLIALDGKGGHQDRSLKAAAVVIPPPVCNISEAQSGCQETSSFVFSSEGSSSGTGITYEWSVINNTAAATISGSSTGATVTIVPSGSSFIAGGSFGLKLIVTRSTGQSTECTRTPAGSIVKVAAGATASPTEINLAAGSTSQLNAVLTGSDDTDPTHFTYSWSQMPATGGSLNDATLRNPVFTATAAGSWTFVVTATQIAAPSCSDTGIVVVNAGASAPLCKVTGPSPICPGSTNDYKYDPDEDGVANAIPANYNAQWSLEGNTNGASLSGSTTGNTVTVISGSTCGTAYTVKITLTSITGLISSNCSKTVSVNDVIPPTITSCPADAIIECGESTLPANTGTATATDNCSAEVSYSDESTPGCYNKITRSWKATDPCGNTTTCTQTILVRDRTAPQIDCSGGDEPIVNDACSATIDVYFRDDGNTRTWTAVDESGNVATCTQDITPSLVSNDNAPGAQEEKTSTRVVLNGQAVKVNPVNDQQGVEELEVKAYPNPFGNVINFRFVSPKSGKATLEIYDLMGRRLGTAFQGNIDANIQKTITYKVPGAISSPIVYKLAVDNLNAHGKLMSSRK